MDARVSTQFSSPNPDSPSSLDSAQDRFAGSQNLLSPPHTPMAQPPDELPKPASLLNHFYLFIDTMLSQAFSMIGFASSRAMSGSMTAERASINSEL